MTNFLFKIACWVTGSDFQMLSKMSGKSRRKVSILAMVVFLPTLIWALSTFILVYQVNESSLIWAIVATVAASLVVFIIERSIVMSEANGRFWKFLLGLERLILGLFVAALGAFALDSVVFDQEIRFQLDRMRHEEAAKARRQVAEEWSAEHALKLQNIERAKQQWENALEVARGEAEGTSGSGLRGVHSITLLKLQIAKQMENEYNQALDDYKQFASQLSAKQEQMHNAALARFDDPGILLRIEALHQLVSESVYSKILYFVFLSIMILIEILPISFKLMLSDTSYDRRELLINEVEIRQMHTMTRTSNPDESHASGQFHKQNARPVESQKARFN